MKSESDLEVIIPPINPNLDEDSKLQATAVLMARCLTDIYAQSKIPIFERRGYCY